MWKSNKTYRFTVVSFERRDIPVLIRISCISWDQRQLGIVTIPHTIIGIDIVVLHPKSIAFGCSSSLLGSCRKWSWLPVFVPIYHQAKGLELELWILWMQNVQQRHRWQIWPQPVSSNAKLYNECILTCWPSPLAKYCRTVKKLEHPPQRDYKDIQLQCKGTVQELCESWGGLPGLSILTSLLVSMDVKLYWTMLRHWSQLVPNMSTDIRGH